MTFNTDPLLSPRAFQYFRRKIGTYHEMFSEKKNRLKAEMTEELLQKSINEAIGSGKFWARMATGAHDKTKDLVIVHNGQEEHWQIKSGKLKPDKTPKYLVLSGHRMQGRLKDCKTEDDVALAMSTFLNAIKYRTFSLAHVFHENGEGPRHEYTIYNFHPDIYKCRVEDWDIQRHPKGGWNGTNINEHGVETSLRATMSSQLWWRIPLDILPDPQKI